MGLPWQGSPQSLPVTRAACEGDQEVNVPSAPLGGQA